MLFMLPELHGPQNILPKSEGWRIRSLGRLMALSHSLRLNDPDRILWWLQIWDWQHLTTSNSVLSDATSGSQISIDHYFLRTSRLLMIVGINLKVYSIEDMSQAWTIAHMLLVACTCTWYTFPLRQLKGRWCTKIFFEPNFIKGGSTAIPWKHWGPLNTRIFQHCPDVVDSATGSRVLKVEHAIDATDGNDFLEYSLRVMDFSPLAIKYGQGLGRLVIEPSTIDLDGQSLTMSLPYVEVVLSKISSSTDELLFSSIDEDRIYMFHVHDCFVKVIKIWEGV
ncbi:uncharacterized protein F5147DRAFT_647486 [Suillus discolor]|uniref:Uncharacterized protein n=1 Tax=Suillus discolor TaxID=1912936 RepID=A0A9P7FJZ1_9AGAM|nr:uncharacterized protein F5147DRAFT_647486 [Suillus discolor]KAG2119547.1 hypothetical protein F5147DRAFT_647486 [Suillus discolor]